MKISPPKPFLAFAVVAISAGYAAPARAFSPFLVVPDPAVAEASPAYRYANMTDAEALSELARRKILFTKLDAVPGVRAPVRLTGRLHGVYVHSSLPPEERVRTPFEILDARLALAFDDFAEILERHDIDEVVHYSLYRPNVGAPAHGIDEEPQAHAAAAGMRPRSSNAPVRAQATSPGAKAPALRGALTKPPPSLGAKGTLDATKRAEPATVSLKEKPGDPAPKPERMVTAPANAQKPPSKPLSAPAPAAKTPLPAKRPPSTVARREQPPPSFQSWAPPGTRHPAGLAIDVALLHKKDGRWLSVARQFQGHIGDRTCGDGAYTPESPDAKELRALVCEASDLGVFTYVLTPDYNVAHADHFHMEIKPGVKWFLYH